MPPIARQRGRPGDRLDSAPEPQGPFQFPRMPFSEIQEDMNLFNRPISKEAFRTPSPDDFKHVSDFFIEEIYEKRPEDFAQPAFGCFDAVEYAELYDDALPKLHHFRQAEELFRDSKFQEFSLRDVHAPEKIRFHWQLSAMLNLLKFRQTRLAIFEEITGNADELAELENINTAERSRLEKEIAAIKDTRAKDEPDLEAQSELVSDLGLKLTSLHKQQLELAEQTTNSKAVLTKSKEHVASLKIKRMSEVEEIDSLQYRVVSSPDRVKAEIKGMESTVTEETESISDMTAQCRSLRMRTVSANKCVHDLEKSTSVLDNVVSEQERVQSLREEHELTREVLKERENEIRQSVNNVTHLERVVVSVQQKVSRMQEQGANLVKSEEDQSWAEKEVLLAQQELEYKRIEEEKSIESKEAQKSIMLGITSYVEELDSFDKQQASSGESLAVYRSYLEEACRMISAENQESFEQFRSLVNDENPCIN